MTSVELAIIAPVVIWWIMLAVQYGLWWHAKQAAEAAAAEAADIAQTPDGSAADGHSAASSFLADAGNLSDITISVDRGDDVVTVEIHGTAPHVVPGWSWTVTARSQTPVEQFLPEGQR